MDAQQLLSQVNELFRHHRYDEIKRILLIYKDITEHNNDLAMTCYLCTIYDHEKATGQQTLFSKVSNLDELLERYTALKFYLRRIDFGVADEMETFYQFLTQNKVSSYELLGVIDFSVVHKDKVLEIINGSLSLCGWRIEYEGKDTSGGFCAERKRNINAVYRKGVEIDEKSEKKGSTDISLVDKSTVDKCNTGRVKTRVLDSPSKEDGVLQKAQEICFIICTNNQAYAQECIYYINHLDIPDGMKADILTVEEAKSLTSAYNEAVQCSQAKYKVYLHHDTFIVNPHFISDCLQIFWADPKIGMIGNIGVKKMPPSGVMWDADRYGMLYEQHIYETKLLANAIDSELDYLEVDAIDGFIMVTQYDIPWRKDLFDKWDFYDCSQSMEFKRKGYKVVVPNMKRPWCVHDCGFINLQNYNVEKEKFIAEYLQNGVGKEVV